jgi:hypothetical protein
MVFLAASLAVATSLSSAAPAAAQAPPVLPADTTPARAAFPPPDSAAPPPPPGAAPVATGISASTGAFGTPGQLVLTVGSDSLQLIILRASGSDSSSTGVLIQPGLDYFVSPNLSVGGLLSYAHASAASIGDNTYGLQVRAGYNLQLSDTLSWWLRGGLGFFHGSGGGGSASTIPFQLYVPVLWHLVPHVFLGFGPTITTDLVTSNDLPKMTYLGAQLILGGYFGVR